MPSFPRRNRCRPSSPDSSLPATLRQTGSMPELPEVEALAVYLTERAAGHRIERIDVAAISALKTFDPPITAAHGKLITGASRHGKFLDIHIEGDLHLVIHLARAGWLHYRDSIAPGLLRPGKGPIALRVRLDDESGFDLTEAGTQKKLSAYLVRDPKMCRACRASARTRCRCRGPISAPLSRRGAARSRV